MDLRQKDYELSPGCNHKIKQKLGWFEQDGAACPCCGASFQTDEFRGIIRRIVKAANQLDAELRRLPRNIDLKLG